MEFLQQVEAILDTPIASLDKKTKLVELGVDSVKLVEVAALIEERYDVPINEEAMFALTVGSIFEFSKRQVTQTTA